MRTAYSDFVPEKRPSKPAPEKQPRPEKRPANEKAFDTPLPEISDTVSSMECTGLFPTPPLDGEELAALESLYSMEIPETEPQD